MCLSVSMDETGLKCYSFQWLTNLLFTILPLTFAKPWCICDMRRAKRNWCLKFVWKSLDCFHRTTILICCDIRTLRHVIFYSSPGTGSGLAGIYNLLSFNASYIPSRYTPKCVARRLSRFCIWLVESFYIIYEHHIAVYGTPTVYLVWTFPFFKPQRRNRNQYAIVRNKKNEGQKNSRTYVQ